MDQVMINTAPPPVRCSSGHACWWEPFWRFDARWIHCRRCCWSSSSHRRARSPWWLLRVLVGR
jgi:hypothetical protein